ncbi:hypothetical protein DD237_004238 [Peronospora effusa]|uniref:Uncharacterized protein n=1 Tax=Peronospora effusa TaxID=542832 RepID=A0A3R7W5L3_9STRA|nr:hypothetical protein DD237_004238 [Peronospora effusa]
MFDLQWLFTECPRLRQVPVLLVHGERDRQRMMKECHEYTNVTPVAPPLPIPYGTHHTKMLVALYAEKVRVAIFTANFLSNDWNTKTQGVWYQDFGLKVLTDSEDEEKKEESVRRSTTTADFETDLVEYLSSLGDQVKRFCRELKCYDFSTARVLLVPSVPGVHKGKGNGIWVELHVFIKLTVCVLASIGQIWRNTDIFVLGSLDEKWVFGEFAESFLPGKKDVSSTFMPVEALHIIWPSVKDVVCSH